MPLYCLCEANNDKPDSQHYGAPNRYAAMVGQPGDFPPLALRQKMVCIKTGAQQVLLYAKDDKPNMWEGGRPTKDHYPNVDVFECPHCRARVVRQ
jgi:hypothetical protein